MRVLLAIATVCAVSTTEHARAGSGIYMGIDLGGVLTEGHLVDRFDPNLRSGVSLVGAYGRVSADLGMSWLAADEGPSDLQAFGVAAALRVHGGETGLGRPFLGVGIARYTFANHERGGVEEGSARGTKLSIGAEFLAGAGEVRMTGFRAALTAERLVASFDDGMGATGVAIGFELTFLSGVGRP